MHYSYTSEFFKDVDLFCVKSWGETGKSKRLFLFFIFPPFHFPFSPSFLLHRRKLHGGLLFLGSNFRGKRSRGIG